MPKTRARSARINHKPRRFYQWLKREGPLIERYARVFSLVVIPIAIALGGCLIQAAIAQQATSSEYVKLAVGILSPSKDPIDPDLRIWAVDVMNEYSRVRFGSETSKKLQSGELNLPTGSDPCLAPAPSNPQGSISEVKFVNAFTAPLNLSFAMIAPNSGGECGAYSYALSAQDTQTTRVLTGCYFAYAWVSDGTNTSIVSGNFCLFESPGVSQIMIGPDNISLR